MPTCCSKLLLAIACLCWAGIVAAHAVQTGAAHPGNSHSGKVHHTRAPALQAPDITINELLQRYSLEGDDALLERAARKLSAGGNPSTREALLQAAWLAQAQHEFNRARKLNDQLLQLQPGNGQAWLLAAALAALSADTERGRAACSRVILTVSPVAGITCFASLARSIEEQRQAYTRIQALPTNELGDSLLAWHWSVRAQLAQEIGLPAEAERYWRRSIAKFPAVQTRAALMDLLLHQQRPAAALTLISPRETTPALAVRELLALKMLGKNITNRTDKMHAQFTQWLKAGDYRHAREIALFYLELLPHSRLAFIAATENAKMQREPQDLALLARATKVVE